MALVQNGEWGRGGIKVFTEIPGKQNATPPPAQHLNSEESGEENEMLGQLIRILEIKKYRREKKIISLI